MKRHLLAGMTAAALALGVAPNLAEATQIFVGYADDLRPTPFFPSPWCGSSLVGVTGTVGDVAGCSGGSQFDSGAVGVFNDGATPITINSLSVTLRPTLGGVAPFALWSNPESGRYSARPAAKISIPVISRLSPMATR